MREATSILTQGALDEQEPERRARAANEGAAAYSKGNMVSQQMDALREHQARQKPLDEQNAQPRPEYPTDRMRREEQGNHDDHADRQRRNDEGRNDRDQKATDYAARFGKVLPSLADGKELTDAQRARYERAAKYLEGMQRERGDHDREQNGGQADRSRGRERER